VRAMVMEASGQALVERELPGPAGDGGELIDVEACGVCHTDLHIASGEFGDRAPMVLGHEVVGQHAELGRVIVYAPWGCRQEGCRPCTEGNEMICPRSNEAGIVDDGGYAQQMRVPHREYLVPVGDADPFTLAPLACGGLTAFRAVRRTLGLITWRRPHVAVIGVGGLGQYALQFLGQLSDAAVVAVDRSEPHRKRALDLGAEAAVDGDGLDGQFDAVIDFVATDSTLAAGAAHLHRQGVLTAVGLFGGRLPFGVGAVPSETLLTTSIWGSRADLHDLMAHTARHKVDSQVEVVPLTDANKALARLAAGDVAGRLVLDASR